jgi:mono/diheme cytochrome c family protein
VGFRRLIGGYSIMARIQRWRGLRSAGGFVLAVLWLFPIEIPSILPGLGLIRPAAAQYGQAQNPGGFDPFNPFGQVPDDSDMPRPGRTRSKAARKKARLPEKGASKKADAKTKGDASAEAATAAGAGTLKFSLDIAPILVANCNGCHSKNGQGLRRGKLDLSSFENLQKGTPDHKVLVAGKPEESSLVLRINGEEEPKMPQGNNNALSADAIAKITRWVKEGARLDAGVDPKAAMDTYAASPEQVRKKQLAQMPAKERDQKVIESGQARWKQSGAKEKPEVVTGTHFILFSTLPNDRATSTVKAMETPYNHLKRLLGPQAMDWPEKVSLYVFSSDKDFIEFVRSVEGRDVDSQDPRFSTKLSIPQPYVAAVDPAGGKREEPQRRRAKGKKAEESEGAGSDRTLVGLLTEGVSSGSVAAAGNAPRWLRDGIGLSMAHLAEPRSSYYRQLRATAFQNVDQGWQTKATQALGGVLPVEDQRAVSFALVECMTKSAFSQGFPAFLRGMLERGPEALDDMIKSVYNGGREEFLNLTGEWVAGNYGRVQ